MPLSFDKAHRLATADLKFRLRMCKRTEPNAEDMVEFNRWLEGYLDGSIWPHGVEDEIRYSANGMGGDPMERFCE